MNEECQNNPGQQVHPAGEIDADAGDEYEEDRHVECCLQQRLYMQDENFTVEAGGRGIAGLQPDAGRADGLRGRGVAVPA